jgi:hypothetical protein
VAVIGTTVFEVTAIVVVVNVTEDAPAGTVTVGGTDATAGLPLVSVTTAPPAGAAPFSLTVLLVVDPPPTTSAGDSVRDVSCAASTVNVAVWVTPR